LKNIKAEKMRNLFQTNSSKGVVWSKVFTVLLLSIITIGCKYGFEVPEEEPVVPDPVVEANAYALPESIQYSGTTTIYWNSLNATSVTFNGVPIWTSGSKTLTSLLKDTSLILKFNGYNGQVITKSVSIEVAEPVIVAPTMYDTISSLYWVFQVVKGLINGEWLSAYFDEDMRTRKLFFYKNKNYEIFKKDGTLIGNGKYEIKQNILELNNDNNSCNKFKISLIDSTMLVYNMDSTSVAFYKGY
jgi:hypothetical protein